MHKLGSSGSSARGSRSRERTRGGRGADREWTTWQDRLGAQLGELAAQLGELAAQLGELAGGL
jgi:hypothetical protein